MQIVLFGASGTIGQRIAREALSRGHRITAVARDPAKIAADGDRLNATRGEVTDPTDVARAARGADALVSAVSPAGGQPLSMLSDAAHALIAGARQGGVPRLVIVGGAGSLQVPEGGRVIDRPTFPAAWKPIAQAHADALDVYRQEGAGLDWTYLSPADVIQPGERTGHYRTGGDQLVVDAQGRSRISTEDFAVALVDELERPAHLGRRFTVAY
jgi:putative NADH-flavin reductase